ncbi:DUF1259 domain-containing protein [Streptomyces sp. AK02-01A]|uniref:DUF1259 domain-containing protein n=1 Tax=Streptomyces sp. AK02-01A TaxID=3028648 RepID=UPI0029AD2714|nr:DUF1259 domain-containing protein [Streptomyces sp. AK02-01A]MDX3853716.1 DUF1259 domain-containing protein [Streptomyces sp. AK02-01A]
MSGDRQQDTYTQATTPRRQLLAAAALAPVLAGVGYAGHTDSTGNAGTGSRPMEPIPTTLADWKGVAKALGRPGNMMRDTAYHTGFPRGDLRVVSYGITVTPGLALGSHMAFVRYDDGSSMVMGDLVIAESELQQVTDTLQARGIEQTAIHKHLLAQTPDVWWTHVHAHGRDPVAMARGLRAALDRTGTPPAGKPGPPKPVDLDTAGIDAALGIQGYSDDNVYKCVFVRRETVTDGGMVLPAGVGSSTAFNFQPLGGGRAAVSGDFAMVADEVQEVLTALRRGGISLVELHNHGLTDEPRLFFTHFWAVDDAVELARALRPAVAASNVRPAG